MATKMAAVPPPPTSSAAPTTTSLPRPIRHFHTVSLHDGSGDSKSNRLLAYYTFATGQTQAELDKDQYHPVLYLHGFPGSGVEGAICAEVAASDEFKCQLFALDRPGFGHSDPLPAGDCHSPDGCMSGVVRDVWDFVRAMQWKSFSLVGVSGGGPFVLAVLDSYLQSVLNGRKDGGKDTEPVGPKLEAVSIVAGVCCSAGVADMMASNQQLFSVASCSEGWKGTVYWYLLLSLVAFQRLLVQLLPEKWIMSPSSPMMKDLPQVDREVLTNSIYQRAMLDDMKGALRQSATPAVYESRVLFRKRQGFEESLKRNWSELTAAASSSSSSGNVLPRVSVFQGHLDVNVPASHSRYVHEELLGGSSRLVEFPEMGHISLVTQKVNSYIEAVALEGASAR